MESLWILINEEYILIDLNISQSTVDIDGKSFYEITFNSGFRKLVSSVGVKKMRDNSEKVDAQLA